MRSVRFFLAASLTCAVLGACGGGEPEFERPTARPRSADPRLGEARAALQEGSLGVARSLLDQLGAGAEFEGHLLRARIEAFEGRATDALREIEGARSLDEADPRSYATAAEIYCVLGRLDAADAEIQRGKQRTGELGPELTRAYGVLAVSTPGNAKLGCALIEEALAADPDLPFCRTPLARGKELVARGAIGASAYAAADALLDESLALVPGDRAARETRANLRQAEGRFGEAAGIYEELLSEGFDVRDPLLDVLRGAAAAAIMDNDRETQVAHYLRMRELGLSTAELGFGASVLERRATELADEAFDLFQRAEVTPLDFEAADFDAAVAARERQFARAETLYREALDCDPGSPKARHGLGAALFRQGRYREAAREWEGLANAFAGEDMPFPLHLDLARAHRNAEDDAAARAVIEEYLRDHPGGRWVDQTQELLETF